MGTKAWCCHSPATNNKVEERVSALSPTHTFMAYYRVSFIFDLNYGLTAVSLYPVMPYNSILF